MAFLRDMKQTLSNGTQDVTKLAKLTIEDIKEELKHDVRQETIDNTLDDLHGEYTHMKDTVKKSVKNLLGD